jgi:hypothetical protein
MAGVEPAIDPAMVSHSNLRPTDYRADVIAGYGATKVAKPFSWSNRRFRKIRSSMPLSKPCNKRQLNSNCLALIHFAIGLDRAKQRRQSPRSLAVAAAL